MLNIRNIFKKRNSAPAPQTAPSDQGVNWGALNAASPTEIVVGEPETLAQLRLTGGANDVGATRALRMYNNHKTRLQNQWINPLQSVNSGFGTAQLSLYSYQNVNYYECMQLAQDPLFAKVFNMLSRTPFSKGGKLTPPDGDNEYDMDALERAIKQYRIWQEMRDGVRSSYVTGGCLVYMDFGLSESERAQPLDLKRINCHKFRRFKHIDPINITAVDVNTVNPTAPDYMEPTLWYVIGLGVVHKSHFLKFEANPVELPMRPLTLYFGMPLTQLIKQDIANSNLASQGLANLINRSRLTYLKADAMDFATDNNGQFRARMEYVSKWQDNFGVMPLKNTEDILQLTTSLTGYSESVELMYLLVSAKTNIPFTELMGKSAQGENATGEGDRRKWYDQCVSIQEDNKDNLLVMCGVVAGKIGDGHFVEFPDYIFDPLEEVSEKELADNIKAYTDVATALAGLGANPDSLIEWLQTFEQFHLENIKFDTSTPGLDDYDDTDPDDTPGGGLPTGREDITPAVLDAVRAMNAKKDANGMLHDEGNGQFTSGGDAGFNQPDDKGSSGEHMAIKCHVDLDGSQICSLAESGMDDKAYRKHVHQWYSEHYADTTEMSPVIGEVKFPMSGWRETESENLPNVDNLKFLPAVKPIIKQSKDVKSEPPKHEHKGHIYRFERVFGVASYKGKPHNISFLIAVDDNGNKFYTLSLPDTTVKKLNEKEPESTADNGGNQVPLSNSVVQERYVVNLFIED